MDNDIVQVVMHDVVFEWLKQNLPPHLETYPLPIDDGLPTYGVRPTEEAMRRA